MTFNDVKISTSNTLLNKLMPRYTICDINVAKPAMNQILQDSGRKIEGAKQDFKS